MIISNVVSTELAQEDEEMSMGCWICPPEYQGQMVVREYADTHDGLLWKRVSDRSDGDVRYYVADATDCGCEDECDCWSPQNVEPSSYDWTPSTQERFERNVQVSR